MRVIYLSEEKTERDLGPMHATGIVKITVVSNSGKKIWTAAVKLWVAVFPLNNIFNLLTINVAQSSK